MKIWAKFSVKLHGTVKMCNKVERIEMVQNGMDIFLNFQRVSLLFLSLFLSLLSLSLSLFFSFLHFFSYLICWQLGCLPRIHRKLFSRQPKREHLTRGGKVNCRILMRGWFQKKRRQIAKRIVKVQIIGDFDGIVSL